ncbi:transposase [Gluconobacter potus]|uniref:transposase n=1 Tax=Gluconobacter potus TaxID=2724927 RepID=UPI0009BF13B6
MSSDSTAVACRSCPSERWQTKCLRDRAALTGILFALVTGIPWEMLPCEIGCGSDVTCWRRLHDLHAADVWGDLHQALLPHFHKAGRIARNRACMDSASFAAKRDDATGMDTTDRGRPGTKRHVVTDRLSLMKGMAQASSTAHCRNPTGYRMRRH